MGEERRLKRAASRESVKNKTTTKIEDGLAILLEAFLTDEIYFKKQINICEKLGMSYPKNAVTGHELPIFNKNPITNNIEMHEDAITLFATFQIRETLIESLMGEEDDSSSTKTTQALISMLDNNNEFSVFLMELRQAAINKDKPLGQTLEDNEELIVSKMREIYEKMKNNSV